MLRRVDGSSVYTVAGADLYTSQRILDAERRLVAAAGRRDGSAVDESAVDLALLEMAANGTALDPGQASLVRQMCTSGARVQLAIAPAGAGKTTAMRALTLAWTEDGGQVLGLAPSAAAAAVLGEQTGITATGATRRIRRTLAATTALGLAVLGAILGVAVAYLATAAILDEDIGLLKRVPVIELAVTLVGVPLVAAAAGWLLSGREPRSLTREP